MSDLFDYLSWRSDLDLNQDSFHEMDALIFSRLSYIPFDGIVSEDFKETISLKEAAKIFIEQERKVYKNEDLRLLKELMQAPRYMDCLLCGYVNQIETEQEKQFSALCIQLNKKLTCISYRGTDNTFVGWKEDFNMAFITPVPSQKCAIAYCNQAMKNILSHFILVGHSKGGNLAVYASCMLTKRNQKKIAAVYNFDGPGFESSFFEQSHYIEMQEKIMTFIPQSSVVGLLLEHKEKHNIVLSDTVSILQHDVYSWQVHQNQLIRCEELTKDSQVIDASIKEWVSQLDVNQRQQFVDALYMVLKETDIQTIEEFSSQSIKNIGKLMSSFKNMSEEDKKNIGETIQQFLKIIFKKIR
ncbi:Mbeg1-like protein [Floccifex sp.]|uniref:Mbeg1-like protein n=1 Tax=Floccifex sp. TaxID=2815810 RepID=UPI003F103176